MRLYFVRHGESTGNAQEIFYDDNKEYPLTEKGRQQALEQAKALENISFDIVYASKLQRAVETADIICKHLELDFETDSSLNEFMLGSLGGKRYSESMNEYAELADSWILKKEFNNKASNGESFNDVRSRFFPFIECLIEKYKETDKNILIVAHGGLYRMMLPLLFTNIDHDFVYDKFLQNAEVVVSKVKNNDILCEKWGTHIP